MTTLYHGSVITYKTYIVITINSFNGHVPITLYIVYIANRDKVTFIYVDNVDRRRRMRIY